MKLINCDLGECLSPDPDSEVMPLIDMANIACGGHAGDTASITKTVLLAKQNGVMVGLHPSYADKPNFGRVSHDLSHTELLTLITQQLNDFIVVCDKYEVTVSYIKPHGALYHDMMHKPEVLNTLCQLINTCDLNLDLVVQAGINTRYFQQLSQQTGIRFMYEAFADRKYNGNQLAARGEQGAVFDDPEQIIEQYHRLSSASDFAIDTICFHSDNNASIEALKHVHRA